MDDLDSSIILEVPETPPDRLGMSKSRSRFKPRLRCFDHHDVVRSSSSSSSNNNNAPTDVEFFFKEANKARELNKDMEPKGTIKSTETIDLSCDSPYGGCNPASYVGHGDSGQLKSRDKGKMVENICTNLKGKNGFASSSCGSSAQNNENITTGHRRPICGQRKLVQNGCISPINIERKKNNGKQKEKEIVVISPESHVCKINSPDSRNIRSDEFSREITLDDIIAEKEQSVTDKSNLNSVQLPKESTSSAAGGWRTTRNHTKNPQSVQNSRDLRIETGRNNGKRKLGSTLVTGHNEECSSSGYKTAECSNVGPSSQMLHPRSTRRQRTQYVMGPVIEVDDLQSPEVESHSVRQTSQLISDEMLARQLQEELYNETPTAVNTTEIDESMALWLQHHDEQTRPPRANQRRSRNPSRRFSRLAILREFHRTQLNTVMEMANNNVDAGVTRLNNFLNTQRDFNEDDYEMLLSLDDNNHQHGGASQSQINNLPQSKIQNANTEEPCAVCLETPAIGDTVRHLPCLHKFHKDCIDTWLKRKRTCPICKSDIR